MLTEHSSGCKHLLQPVWKVTSAGFFWYISINVVSCFSKFTGCHQNDDWQQPKTQSLMSLIRFWTSDFVWKAQSYGLRYVCIILFVYNVKQSFISHFFQCVNYFVQYSILFPPAIALNQISACLSHPCLGFSVPFFLSTKLSEVGSFGCCMIICMQQSVACLS